MFIGNDIGELNLKSFSSSRCATGYFSYAEIIIQNSNIGVIGRYGNSYSGGTIATDIGNIYIQKNGLTRCKNIIIIITEIGCFYHQIRSGAGKNLNGLDIGLIVKSGNS